MPVEPAATPWQLEPCPDDHAHDLWAVGADLEPGTLLAAYRLGLFPMWLPDETLGWWSPRVRGVIPLETRSRRTLRRAATRYEVRTDTVFEEVMRGCADPARPHGWIDLRFVAAYARLHALGWAHSAEAWDEDGLAGGVYGVGIGGLFAAESMFQRRPEASKAALYGLVEHLRCAGDASLRLLDVQWVTPHLALLGAVELERAEYHRRLRTAVRLSPAW